MAEHFPGGCSNIYRPITQWIADNFFVCEGCSVPRCLLYEMYVENCRQEAQTQVNPATFGKLVRLVFPDLGTRRLGTRGSARYHYDGIQIKKSSPFYAYYCYLLAEKRENSGEVCSFENAANHQSSGCRKETKDQEAVGYPLPEFRRFSSWEQELEKKHSCKMVSLFADAYCTHCQEVLQNVKNKDLDQPTTIMWRCMFRSSVAVALGEGSIPEDSQHLGRQQKHMVEELFTSFWKSLKPDAIMFVSQADVCQLFQCYDRQLFQEMEKILLHDFLEDVSIQYLKLVRLFSKNIKSWLLATMEDLPPLLGASKIKEVTLFIKRLRRKTYLANMAKTMRIVLNNSRRVNVLKSDMNAIITQGFSDIPGSSLQIAFRNVDEIESGTELKCLNNLMSSLDTSTDIRVLLNCLSSDLEAFVIQPSKNQEEFRKLAANFQLRWNFLLTSVSRAMTLCHTESFGSWHLFNLLLLEYVIHILQTHVEEEGVGAPLTMPQDTLALQPVCLLDDFAAEQPDGGEAAPTRIILTQSQSDINLSSIILKVLSCLVDADTGNKLIQVVLEDKASKCSVKVNLPVGQEALVTLKDGQKFIIHTSDPQEDCSSAWEETKQI
ncbi:DNA-binding protein RFX8 isoform X1 [Podarcis raffonei]|uniref:DNA-binding protein RFX8 isoform X1 n=1 Tax=Podarcis raffonei TaxID=65483 RepID=UPI0023294909|nr:DNA-binding protein RFX8 isoform X1 [Podarcis raffonei]